MPEDIVDPASHVYYFTAATILSKLARAGTPVSSVTTANAGMFWEHLFPTAGGPASSQLYSTTPCSGIPFGTIDPNTSTLTNTQAMYDSFACNVGDEIVALQYADTPTFDPTGATCFPACSQLPGQTAPTPYNFFMPQFSSLWGWRTSGNSSYHAFNLSLRHALGHGVQFDINYTFSKSIDVGSNAERINVFDTNGGNVGGFSSQVINSWQPDQLRAVSDFDLKHQINSNWVIDLPGGSRKGLWQWNGHAGRCSCRRLELDGTVPLDDRAAVQHFSRQRMADELRSHRRGGRNRQSRQSGSAPGRSGRSDHVCQLQRGHCGVSATLSRRGSAAQRIAWSWVFWN